MLRPAGARSGRKVGRSEDHMRVQPCQSTPRRSSRGEYPRAMHGQLRNWRRLDEPTRYFRPSSCPHVVHQGGIEFPVVGMIGVRGVDPRCGEGCPLSPGNTQWHNRSVPPRRCVVTDATAEDLGVSDHLRQGNRAQDQVVLHPMP